MVQYIQAQTLPTQSDSITGGAKNSGNSGNNGIGSFAINNNHLSMIAQNSTNIEYNNLLVETFHEYAAKFPTIASSVVHLLINYLGEDDVYH